MSTLRRDNGIPADPSTTPLRVRTDRVVLVGVGVWAIVLAVILLVPALHEGDRAWWKWVPVAGIVLGLIGYLYLRRGRGNAEGALDESLADPQSHY
ncbi:DUF2530 domain-containing protein [Janibacter sp. G1551]|uniref:DUF2530 domain-containing protein n=1 Tax=Janibacter sp. G1551 TaxID=3420440 RepID=UPI003CFD254C